MCSSRKGATYSRSIVCSLDWILFRLWETYCSRLLYKLAKLSASDLLHDFVLFCEKIKKDRDRKGEKREKDWWSQRGVSPHQHLLFLVYTRKGRETHLKSCVNFSDRVYAFCSVFDAFFTDAINMRKAGRYMEKELQIHAFTLVWQEDFSPIAMLKQQ